MQVLIISEKSDLHKLSRTHTYKMCTQNSAMKSDNQYDYLNKFVCILDVFIYEPMSHTYTIFSYNCFFMYFPF